MYDPPHGELQEQINWLESRFDEPPDPADYDPADYDGPWDDE